MKRPHIPMQVRLEVALRQLGLDPKTAQLDHDPPLMLRAQRVHKAFSDSSRYIPNANDPRYLKWLGPIEHKLKTTGRRGTSKLSKRGGDISEISKTKRLEQKQQEFRDRVLAKGWRCPTCHTATTNREALQEGCTHPNCPAPSEPRKRAWPKRKFPPARKRTKQ